MTNESDHTANPKNIVISHTMAGRELRPGGGGVASAGGPAAPACGTPVLTYVNDDPLPGFLPIKFEAARASDRVRSRVYSDARLSTAETAVLLSLSEFVDPVTYRCFPKQRLVAAMSKMTRTACNRAVKRLVQKGVIELDRSRAYCVYVFRSAWIDWFQNQPGADSRCAHRAHLDVRIEHISSIEPVQGNQDLYSRPISGSEQSGSDRPADRPAGKTNGERQIGLVMHLVRSAAAIQHSRGPGWAPSTPAGEASISLLRELQGGEALAAGPARWAAIEAAIRARPAGERSAMIDDLTEFMPKARREA